MISIGEAARGVALRRCRSAFGRHGRDPVDRGQDVRQTPHGRLSPGDDLGQDPVPNARLQATRRGHAHMTPDDLFHVKRETAEVEQRGVRTRGYQEIHVTRLDRFPSGRAGKQPVQSRQLLYVTGWPWRQDESRHRHRSTAITDLILKLLVGRVGLEPTTGGL
jgi:hypothetical protein